MQKAGHATTFDVGPIHAVVYPENDGGVARFLLFRAVPGLGRPVLVASGTEDSFTDCLARAQRAARNLEQGNA